MLSLVISSTCFASIPTSCYKLQNQLQSILPSKVVMTPSKDKLCVLTTTSTGVVYEKHQHHYRYWQRRIEKTLQQAGWQTSIEFAADGPFETQFAMKQKDLLAKINVAVDGKKIHCSPDHPIDLYEDCHLTPKERSYVIRIDLLQQHN